jgi:7-carboxy-7-deazaguanine synthase
MAGMQPSLSVVEIFLSIQGEGSRAGLPCTIIRLSGCNLRCRWCDTAYAWSGGESTTIDEAIRRVGQLRCRLVEVTGGEPLAQPGSLELLRRLCDEGHQTLLETNGSIDISPVDRRVVRIVDFKCPSSGQDARNRWENVPHLGGSDEVKFVLGDWNDYNFAKQAVAAHGLTERCPVIFSPVFGLLAPRQLAEWILADGLDVRLGLQLHKIIWPEKQRGV